ncbi:MAG: ribbon-helix-helix domain-containing protein [Alphaproteobacteria bacterium]|jgi:predicted DNA-binding ribbon-helix-helix protein|nr:ribbon-helix-helix domain-containing protein [Alphaproteobacteria bacterium]MCV6599048.1 ribbon-helix-helix domain-containing protein [Alphaproteobacteria bacterium]
MKKVSININGHNTSFTIEEEFWAEFKKISETRSQSIKSLVSEIDELKESGNLSSAIRVFILKNHV